MNAIVNMELAEIVTDSLEFEPGVRVKVPTRELIRDKEELARVIVESALEKVAKLGFSVAAFNSGNRMMITAQNIRFYHPDKN